MKLFIKNFWMMCLEVVNLSHWEGVGENLRNNWSLDIVSIQGDGGYNRADSKNP